MNIAVTAVSAASALVVGDGLEVLVERLGAKTALTRPWTDCPHCGSAGGALSMVPLLRVRRRLKCPSCSQRTPMAWRPALLGVAAALVVGTFAIRFGADVALAPYALLGVALVAISAVDLEHYLIPNRMVYPTLALLVPLLVLASSVDHRWGELARAAAAGTAAFAAFFAVHLAVPKGMGFGDVRLAGVVGLATGWLGFGHAFVGFFAAFVLGAVVGLGVMAVGGGGRKTRIPFGPFLAAGAVVAVVWGNPLANALFHHRVG